MLGATRCSLRKPVRRARRRVATTATERGIGLESAPNRKELQGRATDVELPIISSTDVLKIRSKMSICFENFNQPIITECLIDSGSPVSLVKHSVVPRNIKLDPQNETYFGLNKSLLKSEGKILVL